MGKIILAIILLTFLFIGCENKTTHINSFKQGYKNIVNEKSIFKSKKDYTNESEGIKKAFDKDKNTKFFVPYPENSIIIENKTKSIIKKYSITSGNDAPGRDPRNWTLSGSLDGTLWKILDTKTNQLFIKRGETNKYNLENNIFEFKFYKFDLEYNHTSVYDDNALQIGEIELFAYTDLPVSEFSVNSEKIKIGDAISFKDISANEPDSWQWFFENGIPATSSLQNPNVLYNSPGNHNVVLITKNKFGTDTLVKERKIKVFDPKNPWVGFHYPEIAISTTDTVSKGYKRAISVIPDMEQVIHKITLGVCKLLYKNHTEVPDFKKVNFIYEFSNTLASKGGNNTEMELRFSTKFIQNGLKDEKDEAIKYSINGILWHELTHGYQSSVSTSDDQYKMGYDYFAYLEGMADFVRIKAEYHKKRYPDLGIKDFKYLSGYTTTGFFLKWIEDNYDNDFLYKFNASSQTIIPWSFKKAFEKILNKDVDLLWNKYSNFVKKNKKKKVDNSKKKKIHWTEM